MNNMKSRWQYFLAFLKSTPAVLAYFLFRRKPTYTRIGNIRNITMVSSNSVLRERISSGKPFAAVRFGGTELSAINNYEKIRLGLKHSYKYAVRRSMKIRGGFFPATKEMLNYYGKYMETHLPDVDVLGISGLHMEAYFHRHFTPAATPVQNWALDPLLGSWTPLLKGKKVLVVSPFAEQIKSQYDHRENLFPVGSNILPEFQLKTVSCIFSNGTAIPQEYANWFDVLDHLKMLIIKEDFDIALIGAGAYGTPLCLFAKELGRQAIQTGGATQLLFGIMGKRWEHRAPARDYCNQYWVRPSAKPEGFEHIEKGCYW